jgi:16S rRNA (guanine966-N2)-methyltransferase
MDGTLFKSNSGPFDIIFIDPPYHKNLIEPVLSNLHEQDLIANDGLIIIEYASSEKIDLMERFEENNSRKIGEAIFSILEYNA